MSNQDRAEGKNVPHFHGDDGSPAVTAMRTEFEQWYVTNSFDYPRDPLGSRQCDLQWRAWMAARTTTRQAPGADTPGGRDGEVVIDEGLARDLIDHAEKGKVAEPWMVKRLLEAHPAESSGGDAVDAARWRALLGCGRLRVLGSAGLTTDRGDYAHLGLEMWTQHEAGHEGPAVEWLTLFADKCRAAIESGAECGG